MLPSIFIILLLKVYIFMKLKVRFVNKYKYYEEFIKSGVKNIHFLILLYTAFLGLTLIHFIILGHILT